MDGLVLDELTDEQVAIVHAASDEWVAHALSTAPADRPAAEQGMREAYRAAGLTPPRFMIWLDSPWAGAVGQAVAPEIVAGSLRRLDDRVGDETWIVAEAFAHAADQVEASLPSFAEAVEDLHVEVHDDSLEQVFAQICGEINALISDRVHGQVLDQVFTRVGDQVDRRVCAWIRGQVDDAVHDVRLRSWRETWLLDDEHWAPYLCEFALFDALERLGVTGLEHLHGLYQVTRNAGVWWCFPDFAVLADRPAELHRDPAGRLHCESGPAVRYRDGWGFHAWHGLRVPEWVVTHPDLDRIGAEPNVEIRRCAIESLGQA